MKHIYLLLIACFVMQFSSAQNVNIPDPVFKDYLLGTYGGLLIPVDTNEDGEIQVSEAESYNDIFEVLLPDGIQIFDLTGLEAFTSLQTFEIWNYGSTTINISHSPQWNGFGIHGAPLTSIDLSQNVNLFGVIVVGSQITSIDLSANLDLQYIDLYDNQLTDIILPPNTNLQELYCYNNQLTSLDIRNGFNESVEGFDSTGNPNLQCIYVDDASATYLSIWTKDGTSTFVNNEAGCALLSTPENQIEASIKLYPNPTRNQFTIDVTNGVLINSIMLLDISGKNLMNFDALESYDISSLTSGVYFVKVNTNKGEINKQIIKN